MGYHRTVVLALLVCIAISASSQNVRAQTIANNRYAQKASPTMARPNVEELPMGAPAAGQVSAPADAEGYSDGFAQDQMYATGPTGDGGSSADDCCESCPCYDCGEACNSRCGSNLCCSGGAVCRWFVNADYLNVRAHFSEALSYVSESEFTPLDGSSQTTTRTYHQFDFDRDSSFRVGGGYRLGCCGEEIVFNFTRFRGSAGDTVNGAERFTGDKIELPFNAFPNVGGDAFLGTSQSGSTHASVDADSYDLEFRKTIPLGGTSCSDCGNPCGCGNSCGCACPAWDITWSGGIRGARVDSRRTYILTDSVDVFNNTDTNSTFEFEGAGPRVGIEGRRYFGHGGWFSIYMKGDLSLLFGQLDLRTTFHQVRRDTTIDTFDVDTLHAQQIIPVTEIETGIAANVTCHSTFSAGYLLSAWHDLGFRDQPLLGVQAQNQANVVSYDDANILSFDGFFARLEWAY